MMLFIASKSTYITGTDKLVYPIEILNVFKKVTRGKFIPGAASCHSISAAIHSEIVCLFIYLIFLSSFLGWLMPNLITGLSGWCASD